MRELKLLTPAKIGPIELENHIVMSPMTPFRFIYTSDEKGYTDYPVYKTALVQSVY
jgi:2,4-dienoyl-CoA reductase-like NADH-dependent reductase (Old Yellow Enzyme family)